MGPFFGSDDLRLLGFWPASVNGCNQRRRNRETIKETDVSPCICGMFNS